MKRIDVRPYRPGDLQKVGYHSFDLETTLLQGDSYTGVAEDGHYVFAGGMTFYWPGHGEAWVHLCADVERYIGTFRAVRTLLWRLIAEHGLHRVSAHSLTEETHQRFLRHLGFEMEGFSSMWGPDKEDYLHWGLIPGRVA